MKVMIVGLIYLLASNINLFAQDAMDIIEKSIAYHDPDQKLNTLSWSMMFDENRPDQPPRPSSFHFNPITYDFEVSRTMDEMEVTWSIKSDEFKGSLDGKDELSEDIIEKYRIQRDRGLLLRDYYHYLWALPMKLKDPGTIVHERVERVDFFSKDSWQIKVTYSEEVGGDIWYFYFNPESYALQGYRFYHDESANDGEYILLDGEVGFGNIKLPAERKWYTHKEDKYLGQDKLTKLKFDTPYYEIEGTPESFTASNVVSRLLDGLGFRYYWATEGLRDEDLAYKPSEQARTTRETLEHLFGLSNFVLSSALHRPSKRQPVSDLDYNTLRTMTLLNIKQASTIFREADDLSKFKIWFERQGELNETPFWNQINGPIADALWHCGQVVSFRRASGNPFNSKASVFSGTVRN